MNNNKLQNSEDINNKNIDKSKDSVWKGFHKISLLERQNHLKSNYSDFDVNYLNSGGLEIIRADSMIENCIGKISLPLGLGLNFTINSNKYTVPMAVEEPSVIAAASATAKLISTYGNGFYTYSSNNPMMTGHIYIIDTNTKTSMDLLRSSSKKILQVANSFCQKMVLRGGGTKNIRFRVLKDNKELLNEITEKDTNLKEIGNSKKSNLISYNTALYNGIIVIDLFIDTCNSMGANLINTVCEGVGDYLSDKIETGKVLMKILSNFNINRITTTEFKIPVECMNYKGIPGEEIAYKITKAYEVACLDIFRATTHNKGIMNGIDAVAIALGQDWRAIEAACHSFACIKEDSEHSNYYNYSPDNYKPLSYYKIIDIKNKKYLYGSLTVPIALGVVGGAINSNPAYINLFKILGNPNSNELAGIIASVGLANNLAALRALVSVGTQQGHMSLHAKNVAIRAKVPDIMLNDVVDFMKNNKTITEEAAQEYLISHNLYSKLRNESDTNKKKAQPSNFYIYISAKFLKQPLLVNIAFSTPKNSNSINFQINNLIPSNSILDSKNKLLREILFLNKPEEWLLDTLKLVDSFKIVSNEIQVAIKMKLYIILIYNFIENLLIYNYNLTSKFIENLINTSSKSAFIDSVSIPETPFEINFSFKLIAEINEIIIFHVNHYCKVEKLINLFKTELYKSYINFVDSFKIEKNKNSFFKYMKLRFNRLNCKILVLVELIFSEDYTMFYNNDNNDNIKKNRSNNNSIQNIDFKEIDNYLSFGEYIQIEITLLRDYLKKDDLNEKHFRNSYFYYSTYFDSDSYHNLFEDYKKELFNKFEKNKILSEACRKFLIIINNYYKQKKSNNNTVIIPKF